MVNMYTGTTHEDSAELETGSRWGSGEGRITKIELLDQDHKPIRRCHTGEKVTIRLHYVAHCTIAQPVFGLAIHTVEGIHVTGPNTRDRGFIPDQIEGAGHVDVTFDRLALIQGSYDVSASLYDYNISHCYDFRHLGMRFDVLRGDPNEQVGIVTLNPNWWVDALETPQRRKAVHR